MSPIPAKGTAIEKRGVQYQVVVEIVPKYRGSFNTLAFGEIKPHSGSLRDGRLAAEAQAAIRGLAGKNFSGRNLTVNEAKPREERPRRSFSGSRR